MYFEPGMAKLPPDAPSAATGGVPAAPRESELRRFRDLFTAFEAGKRWINQQYKTHLFPDGARRYNPELEKNIKRFETTIVAEMDKLWLDLTPEEREIIEGIIK